MHARAGDAGAETPHATAEPHDGQHDFDVPTIGEFKGDRGEFFDQEMYEGRAILVRYACSNITPNSAHVEQSYSTDGGKTWEVNWITQHPDRVAHDATHHGAGVADAEGMSLLAGLRERRALGELAVDLDTARARVAALEGVALTMLGCVRALVLDIDELGAPELKAGLSALAVQLRAGGDLAELTDEVARQHTGALAFAEREREYLDHRDAELHRIIQVLSDGLAGVSQGAAAYHRRLLENGSRLEAVSRLSDLVRMRAAITAEVQGLRTAVAERQAEEHTEAKALRSEIEVLRKNVARAQNEARTDPLTGAANRGAFDEELARRCALAAAGQGDFALVFADIDHFKKINDTYGHPVGDRVLTAFVEFLRARVRETDLIARCGGEEFGVILPGATLRPALRKARKLIDELANSDWAVDPATRLRFTASMGVVAWQDGDDAASLIERVDRALYRSKHEGRNRASKAA